MRGLRPYPSILEWKKRSFFAEPHQRFLVEVGRSVYKRGNPSKQLSSFRKDLPPTTHGFRAVVTEIRDLCGMRTYSHRRLMPPSIWLRMAGVFGWSEPRLNLWNNMKRKDNLPFLFLFQGNGFLREWALKQIDEPLRSAFEIIVLADLANNWVEPVRLAADQAIERCYPETSPHLFAEAFSYFQRTHQSWQRWSPSSSQSIERYFGTKQVIGNLVHELISDRVRHPVATFRSSLRYVHTDRHLMRVFQAALNPSLRALALKCMIMGEAPWVDGYEWEWIDKSMGKRRRTPRYVTRKISHDFPRKDLIRDAMVHRSAQVRVVAAQALIDIGEELEIDVLAKAKLMEDDVSPAVRSRVNFLIRNAGS